MKLAKHPRVRALRIGVLGGLAAAVVLALALFILLFLWGQASNELSGSLTA
jgi:high-affinity Fe2+/Pb2+ permease